MFICWGSQAGLNYFYGIDKLPLKEKLFGVYTHQKTTEFEPLLKGFDDYFSIPHSRYTKIDSKQVKKRKDFYFFTFFWFIFTLFDLFLLYTIFHHIFC